MCHRGGAKDVASDERIAAGHLLMSAPCDTLARLVYPAIYPLHDPSGRWGTEVDEGVVELPSTLPTSSAFLSDQGAYLLDNGRTFVLWLGRMVSREWGMEVRPGGWGAHLCIAGVYVYVMPK